MLCPVGGGTIRRHNAIRDELQAWLKKWFQVDPLIEQLMPQWRLPDGSQAQLDVVYVHGQQGTIALDVSVVDTTRVAEHGHRWHTVLSRREKEKHRRYPGPGLIPFVVDVNGRWGDEAESWLRRCLRFLEEQQRAGARTDLRARVSRTLQCQTGEQLALAEASL